MFVPPPPPQPARPPPIAPLAPPTLSPSAHTSPPSPPPLLRWESAKLYTDNLFQKENIAAAKSMLQAIRTEFHEVRGQEEEEGEREIPQEFHEVRGKMREGM